MVYPKTLSTVIQLLYRPVFMLFKAKNFSSDEKKPAFLRAGFSNLKGFKRQQPSDSAQMSVSLRRYYEAYEGHRYDVGDHREDGRHVDDHCVDDADGHHVAHL